MTQVRPSEGGGRGATLAKQRRTGDEQQLLRPTFPPSHLRFPSQQAGLSYLALLTFFRSLLLQRVRARVALTTRSYTDYAAAISLAHRIQRSSRNLMQWNHLQVSTESLGSWDNVHVHPCARRSGAVWTVVVDPPREGSPTCVRLRSTQAVADRQTAPLEDD